MEAKIWFTVGLPSLVRRYTSASANLVFIGVTISLIVVGSYVSSRPASMGGKEADALAKSRSQWGYALLASTFVWIPLLICGLIYLLGLIGLRRTGSDWYVLILVCPPACLVTAVALLFTARPTRLLYAALNVGGVSALVWYFVVAGPFLGGMYK